MDRIERAINNLLVGSCGEINSRLQQVSFDIEIEGTNSKGYCYSLKVDSNGNLRLKDLVEFIDEKLVDYAIPKKDIDEAQRFNTAYTVYYNRRHKHCGASLSGTL